MHGMSCSRMPGSQLLLDACHVEEMWEGRGGGVAARAEKDGKILVVITACCWL